MSKSVAALSLLSVATSIEAFTLPPVQVPCRPIGTRLNGHDDSAEKGQVPKEDSRRKFMGDFVKATSFSVAFGLGSHDPGCYCSDCVGTEDKHGSGCDCASCSHGAGCDCAQCNTFLDFVGVKPASAYYDRGDIGGPTASAETKAFNIRN